MLEVIQPGRSSPGDAALRALRGSDKQERFGF